MGEKAEHPKENGASNEHDNYEDEEMDEEEDFDDMAVEGTIKIAHILG